MDAKYENNSVYIDSTEAIDGPSVGAYRHLGGRKRVCFNRWKSPFILLLVLIALGLSIASFGLADDADITVRRQRLRASSRYVQKRSSACPSINGFKPVWDVYISEGIEETPKSREMFNQTSIYDCSNQCYAVFGKSCTFFSYDSAAGRCTISSADFYSTWTLAEPIDGAVSCFKVRADAWKMLYRRPKLKRIGYNNEVTGPWMDPNYYTNGTLTNYDAGKPESGSWDVLKSQLVNFWENLGIEKVKVSLYVDGKEVHYLIFNGLGSNSESWFKKPFLLQTTWKDLGPANPPFYIDWWWKAVDHMLTSRSMYVLSAHKGCNNDWVWMVLIQNQNSTPCAWDRVGVRNIPRLLYAPGEVHAKQDELTDADHVVISASFLRPV